MTKKQTPLLRISSRLASAIFLLPLAITPARAEEATLPADALTTSAAAAAAASTGTVLAAPAMRAVPAVRTVPALPPNPSKKATEETVNLNSLGAADPSKTPVVAGNNGPHSRMGSSAIPGFKVYFDLDLVNRPGIENLSFDNYHSFLFFELSPTPELQFSFDVNPTPRYYELDYQLTSRLQLRAGKIWIPFDDMSPHNIFGGRVNISRLQVPGAPAFLPDLWTDLGVGAKYTLIDRRNLTLELNAYIVNGFHDGGKDLKNPETGLVGYPSFSDLSTSPDNNRDKALGGRMHAMIAGKLGLGFSYYTGQWSSDSQPTSSRLTILGADAQLRIKSTEFRVGVCSMAVGLPTGDTANRGGAYVELGQKFAAKRDWKVLARAGLLQLDDRVTADNSSVPTGDVQIVGATLLWKPGLVEYSIETSRDFKISPSKVNYSYTAARIIMAF